MLCLILLAYKAKNYVLLLGRGLRYKSTFIMGRHLEIIDIDWLMFPIYKVKTTDTQTVGPGGGL